MNPTTMSAQFKQCFGVSIFGYLRRRRLEAARELLRREDDSVARIGYRVGFDSPAAFSTAYKRQFGHSPSQETRLAPLRR
nr:AraC family transcriptional regulator [Paracoccus siganidrum]